MEAFGPPTPVAPIDQVEMVLTYATSVVPPNQLMLGMNLYGYDWFLPYNPSDRAVSISSNSAQNLAATENVPINWNEKAAAPFIRYMEENDDHVIWFEDALSSSVKFNLVYEYNLRGISFWYLPNSFPQNWYLLRDSFRIRKLP